MVIRLFLILVSNCAIAFLLLVPFVSSSSSSSAGNRNTYNVYNYDQTTPQFTPDGRLLQVEYASSAADRSPPLVVLECISPATDEDGDEDDDSMLSYPCTILITIPKQVHSPQNRIVIVNEKDFVDDQGSRSYCVAMSGILSDSLALLQAGMKVAAQDSLQYQRPFGMESLTQALADECQSRVFAGGLRPYGSTLLLCGYNNEDAMIPVEEPNDQGDVIRGRMQTFRSSIYQTDPSGGILQHYHHIEKSGDKHSQSTGKGSKSKKQRRKHIDQIDVRSQVRCIVGGSSSLQRQLYKRIQRAMVKFEQQQRDRQKWTLAERIAGVAKVLIQETKNDNDSSSNTRSSSSKNRNPKENGSSTTPSSSDCPLEVVIVSPKYGCHRLDDRQLRAIQALINGDE